MSETEEVPVKPRIADVHAVVVVYYGGAIRGQGSDGEGHGNAVVAAGPDQGAFQRMIL